MQNLAILSIYEAKTASVIVKYFGIMACMALNVNKNYHSQYVIHGRYFVQPKSLSDCIHYRISMDIAQRMFHKKLMVSMQNMKDFLQTTTA